MSYWHTASFVAACDTFHALYAKSEGNPRRDYNGMSSRKNVARAQTPRRSPHPAGPRTFSHTVSHSGRRWDAEYSVVIANIYIILRAKWFRRADGYITHHGWVDKNRKNRRKKIQTIATKRKTSNNITTISYRSRWWHTTAIR